MSTSCPILGVIFDGDDTLWSTERLYDSARAKARRVVTQSGLDGAKWETLERQIDVQNVASLGFSKERFPASCVSAYEAMCHDEGRTPDPSESAKVREAALSVFAADPQVVSRARKTLKILREKGQRLALLTKGDREVQARRIERSGLRDMFDVIEIVPEKSPAVILAVVARLGIDVRSACMVGNSVRSDLLPAIEAGLQAVWIRSHVWEYERVWDHLADDRFTALPRLADIANFIT